MNEPNGEVTALLDQWSDGDESALDRLVELTYDDLRRIANSHLRTADGERTMSTTVLVHELYLKLAGIDDGNWNCRQRFFAFCSKAMRRILIDHARAHRALKRGGGRVEVTLEDAPDPIDAEAADLIALDEALQTLASRNERMVQIVECRFFGGLSVPETAEALGTSTRTVEREWARARAYLRLALGAEAPSRGFGQLATE